MRIIHIIVGLNIGGAELMLKKLVLSQVKDGKYDVIVISLTNFGHVGHQLREKGITVIALNLKSIFQFANVFLQLFRIISQEQPKIVQTWMYHADLIGGVAAKLAGCSKIIWELGIQMRFMVKDFQEQL